MAGNFKQRIKRRERKYFNLGNRLNLRQRLSKELILLIRRWQGLSRGQVKLKYSLDAWHKRFTQGVAVLYNEPNYEEAVLLRELLKECGIQDVELVQGTQADYRSRMYFVLCPQYYKKLPEFFISVQTEVYDSADWFNAGFIKILERSAAILDVSVMNIDALITKGIDYKDIFLFSFAAERRLYYLARMLLAFEVIDVDKAFAILKTYEQIQLVDQEFVVLSMPESTKRRSSFCKAYPNIPVFDGLRHIHAWMGCALSYKYLASFALDKGIKHLAICEDDVLAEEFFAKQYNTVQEFLFQYMPQNKWDMFVGVLAEVADDITVLAVKEFEGIKFVTVDQMVSTVFNIYNTLAMEALATWDVYDRDVETNTIDRHLGRVDNGFRTVTTLPFLVGHDGESTLWGSGTNESYKTRIAAGQDKLAKKVQAFETAKKRTHRYRYR